MMRHQPNTALRSQNIGGDNATSYPTFLTAANGSKGAWGTLGTTAFDWHLLLVDVATDWNSFDALVDLGIDDGAGNTYVIAPNLRNFFRSGNFGGACQSLPLYVPAGSLLKARAQSQATFGVGVTVHGFSRGLSGAAGYGHCHALFTPSGSRGTVIDAGGTANTKGSWTQLVASTGMRTRALSLSIDHAGDVARSLCGWLFDIAFGASGSEQTVLANLALSCEATNDTISPISLGPLPVDIPSGVRVAARAQCSVTTAGDRTFGLNVWGFGP